VRNGVRMTVWTSAFKATSNKWKAAALPTNTTLSEAGQSWNADGMPDGIALEARSPATSCDNIPGKYKVDSGYKITE